MFALLDLLGLTGIDHNWIFGALRPILLPHDPIALTHWGT